MHASRAAEEAVPALPHFTPRSWHRLALEALCLLALAMVALANRLPNLDDYTGKFDEGIRTAQLMLMSHGFRPVRDIFASQGPLSLDVFFPFWEASGETLGGARLAVVCFSILAIVLSALVARSASTPLGGIITAAFLAISPTFLKNSRLALVEIPAMVPALLALLAVIYGRERRSHSAIALGSVALVVALAVKPMVAPVLVPFGLLLLIRRGGPRLILTDLMIAAMAGGLAAGVILLAYGPEQMFNQIVRYRQGSMAVEKWSFGENWRLIADELAFEQTGFFALAGVGLLTLLWRRPAFGIASLGWIVASLWLLITYVPLQIKHDTIMVPPLAIVAGAGFALMLPALRTAHRTRLSAVWAAVGMICLLGYLVGTPAIFARNRQTINVAGDGRAELYSDETELVQALTRPDAFIISDDPFLSYGTGRLVPPLLVDTSYYRIRSGSLSPQDIIDSATRFDVKLLFLFTDGLRELKRFADWVDENYQVITVQERRNGKDRSIYLRRDANFDVARDEIESRLDEKTSVTFGDQMRLLGYSLDRREIRNGGSLELSLALDAVAPVAADYRIVTVLRGPDGQPTDQSERSISGGGIGTSQWAPGRWVFRTALLDIRRARQPGQYTLSVGLYDSRAKLLVPVSAGGRGNEPGETVLTTITVRQ